MANLFTLQDLGQLAVLLKLYKKELELNLTDTIELYDQGTDSKSVHTLEQIIEDIDTALSVVQDDLNYRLTH